MAAGLAAIVTFFFPFEKFLIYSAGAFVSLQISFALRLWREEDCERETASAGVREKERAGQYSQTGLPGGESDDQGDSIVK